MTWWNRLKNLWDTPTLEEEIADHVSSMMLDQLLSQTKADADQFESDSEAFWDGYQEAMLRSHLYAGTPVQTLSNPIYEGEFKYGGRAGYCYMTNFGEIPFIVRPIASDLEPS